MKCKTQRELLDYIEERGPSWSERSLEIEEFRDVPPDILNELRTSGIFGMAFDKKFGGMALDSIEQMEVLEKLSYYDSSLGWSSMIGMDGGLYSAFLEDIAVVELYGMNADRITGGVIQPDGVASPRKGGYLVSGSYRLGSGVKHADVISAGAIVEAEEYESSRAESNPSWIVCLLNPGDITIKDDWFSTGLRGSGSVSYSFSEVFVPERNTFNFSIPKSRDGAMAAPDTIMRKMIGVPLGTVRRLLDETISSLLDSSSVGGSSKADSYSVQSTLGSCECRYWSVRHAVQSSLTEKMSFARSVDHYSELSAVERSRSVAIAQHSFRELLDISRTLYDLVGSKSVYRGSRFDLGLRDMVTLCQHVMAKEIILQSYGAALLGREPGFPFALGDTL